MTTVPTVVLSSPTLRVDINFAHQAARDRFISRLGNGGVDGGLSNEGRHRPQNGRANAPLLERNGVVDNAGGRGPEYPGDIWANLGDVRMLSLVTPQSTGGSVRCRTPQSPPRPRYAPFAYNASGGDHRFHPCSTSRYDQATRANEYAIYGPGGRQTFSCQGGGAGFSYVSTTGRPKDILKAWARYETKRKALDVLLAADGEGTITFADIPVPVLDPRRPITENAVQAFVLSPFHSPNASKRRRIHRALRIYHPDKASRILKRLATGDDREKFLDVAHKVIVPLVKLLPKPKDAQAQGEVDHAGH